MASTTSWLGALRRYLSIILVANLLWEVAQLPLYTIWREGTAREIAFAVLHCTAGDVAIAGLALVMALVLVGDGAWPARNHHRVASLGIGIGIGYTIFSEWLNIVVRKSWAYSDLMPIVPLIDTGLSPLLQWLIIPLAAFAWARAGSER